jgi:hypothetical protein
MDCRRFAPAAHIKFYKFFPTRITSLRSVILVGARMTKKGKPVGFMPKTNGFAISKCIVHSKIEASFIFLLPLHFLTPFSFGH